MGALRLARGDAAPAEMPGAGRNLGSGVATPERRAEDEGGAESVVVSCLRNCRVFAACLLHLGVCNSSEGSGRAAGLHAWPMLWLAG